MTTLGASSQAVINAGVAAMKTPNVGDISVSAGLPLANHVIHANCCPWHDIKGEAVSVFVVICLVVKRNLEITMIKVS